jgi:hypothetical protein
MSNCSQPHKGVFVVTRKNAVNEFVIEEATEAGLTELDAVSGHVRPRLATLSFPVRGAPVYAPIYDNGHVIAQIIRRRHPALLLCGGWTLFTKQKN